MNDSVTKLKEEVKREDAAIDDLISRNKHFKNKRVPFSKAKKLSGNIELDKDYHYFIANHTGNNLDQYLKSGYEFVESETHKKEHKDVSHSTHFGKYVSYDVGGGIKGYLLRLKNKYWVQDEASRQKEIDETEKEIGLDRLPHRIRRGKVKIDHSTS